MNKYIYIDGKWEKLNSADETTTPKKVVSMAATVVVNGMVEKTVHEAFSQLALDLAHATEHVMVTTYDYLESGPEPGEEFYDENTLFKVLDALQSSSTGYTQLSGGHARELIRELQNAGILFRERRPDRVWGKHVEQEESDRPKDCGGAWCTGCSVHLKPVPDITKNEYSYKLPEELNPKTVPPMYNA